MPLKSYGVLKGRAINSRIGLGSSPHYQVHIVDDTTDYRIAINVKSKLSPSELLYLVADDFQHPMLDQLSDVPNGFTNLDNTPGGSALDYIRGNLFDPKQMKPLPHNIPGPDNDLNEKIDAYIQRAIADEDAEIYAFGERWGPEQSKKDKHFGFLPGNGIHDIHMNQGNVSNFVHDDGVWQDGGLLIHYPQINDENGIERWPEQWVAVFLAFQSQSWHTNDETGHKETGIEDGNDDDVPPTEPETDPDPIEPAPESDVRIIAALVNPEGADPGLETISLINLSPNRIDLTGWAIADRNKKRSSLDGQVIDAGATVAIKLDGKGAQLSNKGGIITLLDPQGLKQHGVAYTKTQAKLSAWTILFA